MEHLGGSQPEGLGEHFWNIFWDFPSPHSLAGSGYHKVQPAFRPVVPFPCARPLDRSIGFADGTNCAKNSAQVPTAVAALGRRLACFAAPRSQNRPRHGISPPRPQAAHPHTHTTKHTAATPDRCTGPGGWGLSGVGREPVQHLSQNGQRREEHETTPMVTMMAMGATQHTYTLFVRRHQ